MDRAKRTAWVVEQARALGFDLCGVTPVEDFPELGWLPEWLARGYAGEMGYLSDARRHSPRLPLEGARSLIVCALNFNSPLPYSTQVPVSCADGEATGPRGWISRYAWGDDYHHVMSEKLEALLAALRANADEPFEARAYVDTGPVVERVAAKHAGLGWLAKNTALINSQLGSWLFLGVILTTLDLAASPGDATASVNEPPPDLCGNCRLCIDACPTGAIVEPYVLDARRCIAYLTIELHGSIPAEFRAPMGRHVFGCDICQDVCPWNRKAPVTSLPEFQPRRFEEKAESPESKVENLDPGGCGDAHSLFAPELERLAAITEGEFREVFRGSAVKRTKWQGLVRNACVALGNSGVRPGEPAHSDIVALLGRLAASGDEVIAEHARWALDRLPGGPTAAGTGLASSSGGGL